MEAIWFFFGVVALVLVAMVARAAWESIRGPPQGDGRMRVWFCENLVVPEGSGFARTSRAAKEFVCGMFNHDSDKDAGVFTDAGFGELVSAGQAKEPIVLDLPRVVAITLITRCEEIRESERVR